MGSFGNCFIRTHVCFVISPKSLYTGHITTKIYTPLILTAVGNITTTNKRQKLAFKISKDAFEFSTLNYVVCLWLATTHIAPKF